MPLFGKKDSGKKVRKDGHKDIDKQIINIEDKYHLRQVLGKWVLNIKLCRNDISSLSPHVVHPVIGFSYIISHIALHLSLSLSSRTRRTRIMLTSFYGAKKWASSSRLINPWKSFRGKVKRTFWRRSTRSIFYFSLFPHSRSMEADFFTMFVVIHKTVTRNISTDFYHLKRFDFRLSLSPSYSAVGERGRSEVDVDRKLYW